MIIQHTKAFCQKCKNTHYATIEETGGRIIAVIHCPTGKVKHEISPDAEIYLNLYRRFEKRKTILRPTTRCILNYIPITNACNFNCKVCCANVKSEKDANYLDKNEVIKRLENIKQNGGILVNFFGGEATLHPDILEVVHAASELHINVGIASNGFKLGTDQAFVHKLQLAGLNRIGLHFDSLKHSTLKKLGHDYLDIILKAVENCEDNDIKLGLNCTVSDINLDDLTETMDFALQHVPHIYNMSLLSMAPVGRYEEGRDRSVFREDIIKVILKKWSKYGLVLEDIVHLPSFSSWGVSIHPDCGAGLLMVKNGTRIYPLNHILDLEKLFTLMGRSKLSINGLITKPFLALCIVRSLRLKKIIRTIRLGLSMLCRCKRSGIINFGLTNYKTIHFQDEEKLKYCTCLFYTAAGPIKGCHHFAMPDTFKGSVAYQQKNNLL